jgi:hypothetical protein
VVQIIVTEDADGGFGEATVVLRERVPSRNLESDCFAAQLLERLGWAVAAAVGWWRSLMRVADRVPKGLCELRRREAELAGWIGELERSHIGPATVARRAQQGPTARHHRCDATVRPRPAGEGREADGHLGQFLPGQHAPARRYTRDYTRAHGSRQGPARSRRRLVRNRAIVPRALIVAKVTTQKPASSRRPDDRPKLGTAEAPRRATVPST